MSNRLKILKEIVDTRSKQIQHPNLVNIYTEEESLYLDINGIAFTVEIVYRGSIYIESNLGFMFRVNYSGNKITIVNLFGTSLPDKLFDFNGDIEIIDCQVTTYNGESIKASITNNNRQTLIQVQKTNVEDDTLIIKEEPETFIQRPMRVGKKPIDLSNRNREKLDTNQLLTIIPKFTEYKKKRIAAPVTETKVTLPVKKTIKKEPTTKGGKY